MQKQILFIILALLLVSQVMAITECQRTTKIEDIPCRQPLSYVIEGPCTDYLINIYNATNDTIQSVRLQEGTPFCFFTFNITKPGFYPWANASLEWGNITVKGGDDMLSLTVIGFLLVFNVILFIIPFKAKLTFMEGINGEVVDYIAKRAIWMISTFLFYYIFLMVAQLGINYNMGLETALRGLISIFTFSLYIVLGWLAITAIMVPIKMWKGYLKQVRMGDYQN